MKNGQRTDGPMYGRQTQCLSPPTVNGGHENISSVIPLLQWCYFIKAQYNAGSQLSLSRDKRMNSNEEIKVKPEKKDEQEASKNSQQVHGFTPVSTVSCSWRERFMEHVRFTVL